MEDKDSKIFNKRISSISSASNFTQSDFQENDVDDPLKAYFKKRCKSAAKTFFQKNVETENDSSLDVLDIDSVSTFGDSIDIEKEDSKFLRNSFPITEKLKNDSKKTLANPKYSDVLSKQISDPKLYLEEQRILAKKTLKKLNSSNHDFENENTLVQPEISAENQDIINISDTLKTSKLQEILLQTNCSPDTPRYFKDELNSFGGEGSVIVPTELKQEPTSEYHHNENLITFEDELRFECQSFEEKIQHLEEEEEKFKLENTALLHNSNISEFSGVASDIVSKNLPGSAPIRTQSGGKLSFGKFFNERSNSISSIFGPADTESVLFVSTKRDIQNSPTHEQSLPLSSIHELTTPETEKLRPRRCFSSYDLTSNSEVLKNTRVSNESSNSTVFIQDILTKMEPGLSGTQIYEELINQYRNRKCMDKKSEIKKLPGNYQNYNSYNFKDFEKRENILKLEKHNSRGNQSDIDIGLNDAKIIKESITPEKNLSNQEFYRSLISAHRKESENKQLQSNNETPKSSKILKKKEKFSIDKIKNDIIKEQKDLQALIKSLKFSSEDEDKENELLTVSEAIVADISNLFSRDDKIKKLKGKKGFDASTPKFQHGKSRDEKFQNACSRVLMKEENWEVPKISFNLPSANLNKTSGSEENEKTLIVNSNSITSSESTKKNSTIVNNEISPIENTIMAGDLTILAQRIDEMKEDGVCIVRSEEPMLLKVVQKLANLPKGSIDCSALTPLLRDQFPELLSGFSNLPTDQFCNRNSLVPPNSQTSKLLVSEPGSWVKLPCKLGFADKIYAFPEIEKNVLIPISNVSNNWLLVSISSTNIPVANNKVLLGEKKSGKWDFNDFASILMKDTIIPPQSQQSIQISLTSRIALKIDLNVSLQIEQLFEKIFQSRNICMRIHSVNPINTLNIIPKHTISFGTIADECFDERIAQLTFNGISELPLNIFIEEDSQSPHFFLKPLIKNRNEEESPTVGFSHLLKEGEKQLLEFKVVFQPTYLLRGASQPEDFEAMLVLKIGVDTETDGVLQKIPISGSVASAKFMFHSSSSPLVFRVTQRGESITKSLSLKNTGSMSIGFTVTVENEETGKTDNDLFTAPKSFYLYKNEESAMNITFNSNTNENCVKRILGLKIIPNGRPKYTVELIGLVTPTGSKLQAQNLNSSVSVKSLSNSEAAPVRLLTTSHCLSWSSVALEKEIRQSFQIKNSSNFTATVLITFKNELSSFKLINENGEKVKKMRKVLKPDIPYALTLAFCPNSIGSHQNILLLQTNQLTKPKMVFLSGVGGLPNLYIGNIKSDLTGCKMIILQNPSSNQLFFNNIEFKNVGRISGFISIKLGTDVLSLKNELMVSPTNFVLAPGSKISVKLAQKISSENLRLLLSGKDICKIATINLIMGDEYSRLRYKKLVKNGKILPSERSKIFTSTYNNEKEINLASFKDLESFENLFLKSIKVVEVAVVIEKTTGCNEPTIFLEEDETLQEFETMCSVKDNTIASTIILDNESETDSGPSKSQSIVKETSKTDEILKCNSKISHSKVTRWLDALEQLGDVQL